MERRFAYLKVESAAEREWVSKGCERLAVKASVGGKVMMQLRNWTSMVLQTVCMQTTALTCCIVAMQTGNKKSIQTAKYSKDVYFVNVMPDAPTTP